MSDNGKARSDLIADIYFRLEAILEIIRREGLYSAPSSQTIELERKRHGKMLAMQEMKNPYVDEEKII